MNSKAQKLKELLENNPLAQSQSEVIAEALALVQKLRDYGRMPHGYGLEGPFGDRTLLRRPAAANSRISKMTEST